jgi:hypothetical protein
MKLSASLFPRSSFRPAGGAMCAAAASKDAAASIDSKQDAER